MGLELASGADAQRELAAMERNATQAVRWLYLREETVTVWERS